MKISVVSLFRDSEGYLQTAFRLLEGLERHHDAEYFFYENDSADATPELLRGWMAGRRGTVVTETLGMPRFAQDTEPLRLAAMAQYRNRILAEAAGADAEWTLLLDSDVVFPETIVEQYLATGEPGVAMFTPFVEHNVRCRMCDPPCGRPAYYDTFALRDRNDRIGQVFSCNPFWIEPDRTAWWNGHPVEVHSAFGGAALIRSDVLAQCHWDSDGDCEHIPFARQVRTFGRILAVPTVKAWTTVREREPGAGIVEMQRRLLENPLLLQFWTLRNRDGLSHTRRSG